MNDAPLLTFHAPARTSHGVDVLSSPVLELSYAAFALHRHLTRPGQLGGGPGTAASQPAWLAELVRDAPGVVKAVRSVVAADGDVPPTAEVMILAVRYGFVGDATPDRFLDQIHDVAARATGDGRWSRDADEASQGIVTGRIQRLSDRAFAAEWSGAMGALWTALRPTWDRVAAPSAQQAVRDFRAAFEAAGDVLDALPKHHFARFESGAASVRRAQSDGRVLVVPLALATDGGMLFDVDDVTYVGYGVASDTVHAGTRARMDLLARRMKAFADPTRAMLLATLGRYGGRTGIEMTVGDLAGRVAVSQPTVSGHLKILSEAGLVQVERRGTRAFYTLDVTAVQALLDEVGDALVGSTAGPDDERPATIVEHR